MRYDERVIRALDGTLGAEASEELREAARRDPRLQRRLAAWEEIRGALAAETDAFAPGFTERVMRAVSAPSGARGPTERAGAELLHLHLSRAFPRLAAACLLGAVALGLYALVAGGGLHGNVLEALLGLPGTTLESVLVLASA